MTKEVATLEDQKTMIATLQQSLYVGASENSIKLVLDYCKRAGLDPMHKPVHIVPMWNRDSKSMKDVIMPGIGSYRIMADRSKEYAGITEPEFGDTKKSESGVKFENLDLIEKIGMYVRSFYFSTRIPRRVSVKSMKAFLWDSHYGNDTKASSGYISELNDKMKVRYAGNKQTPCTDGKDIFFNRSFFTEDFYTKQLGISEEDSAYVAVLFYNAICLHRKLFNRY